MINEISHTKRRFFGVFSRGRFFINKKETEFLEMGSYFVDSTFIFFDRDIEVFLFLCLFY